MNQQASSCDSSTTMDSTNTSDPSDGPSNSPKQPKTLSTLVSQSEIAREASLQQLCQMRGRALEECYEGADEYHAFSDCTTPPEEWEGLSRMLFDEPTPLYDSLPPTHHFLLPTCSCNYT